MQSAKAVTLIPAKENQIGGGNEETGTIVEPVEKTLDKIKSKIYDKIHRFIKIILKLARTVGYDDDLRIKLTNGKYLEKSNIVDLLTHAMSAGKVLYGENEFIELLAESDVNPDLIINDNVRIKLIQFKNKNKKSYHYEDKEINTEEIEKIQKNKNLKFYNGDEEIKVIKKGPKRIIMVNDSKKDKNNDDNAKNIIVVGKDGALIEKDNEMEITKPSLKRRRSDLEEDSVDDDLIDKDQWMIN